MTVIVLEKVPVALRGELTRWLLEIASGVFVGTISGLVRDLLWLNQLDFAPSQPPHESMNLSATVCHVFTQFQPLI